MMTPRKQAWMAVVETETHLISKERCRDFAIEFAQRCGLTTFEIRTALRAAQAHLKAVQATDTTTSGDAPPVAPAWIAVVRAELDRITAQTRRDEAIEAALRAGLNDYEVLQAQRAARLYGVPAATNTGSPKTSKLTA